VSKHFNLGNVWGRVSDANLKYTETGTPYLAIQVECGNELHGNIRTYGRLWGQVKIDSFLDYYKQHPGSAYRFKGFFSQYDKEEGVRYSNYTFFAWEPFTGSEFRAAFILTGEVTAVEKAGGEGKLSLHLERPGSGDYPDVEEDFEVYTPNAQQLDGISEGNVVQVKGLLCYKEQEDYFGGTPENNVVRPYVKGDIKVIENEKKEENHHGSNPR